MKRVLRSRRVLGLASVPLVVTVAAFSLWQYQGAASVQASGVVSIDVSRALLPAPGDELTAERTETAKKYSMGGNSFAVDAYVGPIHYKDNYADSSGPWKDIDLAFDNGRITKAPYNLSVNTNDMSFAVADKKTGQTASVKLTRVGGTVAKDMAASNVTISVGRIQWDNVTSDLDLAISAYNSRVSFDWVVKSEDAPHEVEFEIHDGGLPVQYRGLDADGKAVEVLSTKAGDRVTERIEKGGKYPKTINPTIDLSIASSYDDGCVNGSGYYPADSETGVGNESSFPLNSWYRFTGLTIPLGATITSNSYLRLFAVMGYVPVSSRLFFDDQLSPSYPGSAADYESRAATTSYTDWQISTWGMMTWRNSPSLQSALQELVTSYGQLTTVQVLHKDNGSSGDHRVYAMSYDVGGFSPRLHVEYTWSTLSNTPSSHNFGAVGPGSAMSTGLNYFTVTNNSGSAVNITIGGTDITGGTTWTLSDTATPGIATAGMKAGLDGGAYNIIVKKTAPFNILKASLASSASQAWGLQLLAPTNYTDDTQKAGTVTLTATAP